MGIFVLIFLLFSIENQSDRDVLKSSKDFANGPNL